MLIIIPSITMAQCSGGSCSQGGGGFEFADFGQGIYHDPQTNQLSPTPTAESTPATPEQLAASPDSYVGLQEHGNQMQREGFTQNRFASEFNMQVEGHTGQGQWSPDGNSFSNHGVELNKQQMGDSYQSAEFNPDGEVNMQTPQGGEMSLQNNDPSQGSMQPQSGANAGQQPELSSPEAGGGGGEGAGGQGQAGGGEGGAGGQGQAGAGGAEQTLDQKFQAALGTVQQLVGLLGQLATPFTDSLKSNGEGSTSIETPNEFGGITAALENGAALAMAAQGVERMEAMQNDPTKAATIKTKSTGNEVEVKNANFLIAQQLTGSIQDTATIKLGGIDGNSPNHPSLTSNTLAAASLQAKSNIITTAAITFIQKAPQGQYVSLFDHNIDVKGSHLQLHALKTFDSIEAEGSDITFYSGDIQIKIEGQKILYPRLVKKAPYGFKSLTNTLDSDQTQFVLQHYENKKSLFYENNYITTAGDIVEKHPNKKIVIAQVRKDMWKKR